MFSKRRPVNESQKPYICVNRSLEKNKISWIFSRRIPQRAKNYHLRCQKISSKWGLRNLLIHPETILIEVELFYYSLTLLPQEIALPWVLIYSVIKLRMRLGIIQEMLYFQARFRSSRGKLENEEKFKHNLVHVTPNNWILHSWDDT